MEENTLSVLKIAPGQYPQQVEIDNDLKALQQAVGGSIGARCDNGMLSGNIGMSMRCGIGRKIVVQSIPQRMEATSMVVVQTENQNLQNINGGTVKVLRDFCETRIAGHFSIHTAPLSQCRCRPSSRGQPSEEHCSRPDNTGSGTGRRW